ncbi:MAG: UDP-N,N'-diacetylbacillosamine 2-epimerase (hydrolyzing) [Syntrophorhabdus sp. PtaB.Bin027]|nr:MAG: UDP-N,N'-diacetylbacillosamine 2-epimerase (hydrolyzing) [Syntrophorhabdus sp. PtaB.Bin027]
MKKRIVYISGSRADFGRIMCLLNLLDKSDEFNLEIIVTGMHLSMEFGNTTKEIERHFHINEKVDALLSGDSASAMAKSFGIAVIGISQALERIKPDMVILLGDRGEMLAGAIAAKHQNILISHIGGGDKSGSIDDKIRDAITVFSDFHFVANRKTLNRVLSLGAKAENSFIVGAPDLDVIRQKEYTPIKELRNKYHIDPDKPLVLVSYHPVTNEELKNAKNMNILCESLLEMEVPCIITYPNADAGGRQMIDILNKYKNNKYFSIYPHISYTDYLGLMSIATAICGNSSAGIIEAPSFQLPTVNIGSRQKERLRAINVIDVCELKDEIIKALNIAIYDKKYRENLKECVNPYGNGMTSEYIYSHLKKFFNRDAN